MIAGVRAIAVGAGWTALAILGQAGPAVSASSSEAIREQSEKVIDARGVKVLQVRNARGLISVRPSQDGKIRLTALKIVRGSDSKLTRELANSTSVEAGAEGDRYVVRVRYQSGRQIRIGFWDLLAGGEFPRVEVRLALDAPPGLELDLESTSGDVTTDAMQGRQALKSTSGDVDVGAALGPLSASTTSGDVEIDRLVSGRVNSVSGDVRIGTATGPLTVGTTSGEVDVDEASDSLRVTSVSGDVSVSRARRGVTVRSTSGDVQVRAGGRISAETASGDVGIDADAPIAGIEARTVSGEVTARLGSGVACQLDVRTSSGSIEIDVPMSMQSVSRRHVSGRIGNGTAQCVLRSSSGDIHVE